MIKKTTRAVIQRQSSDCGLACVTYILNAAGIRIAMDGLGLRYDVLRDGLNFQQLMYILNEYGVRSTPYKLEFARLPDLQLPAILFWNRTHFVVLESVSKNRYTIMDPAYGHRRLNADDMRSFFSGYALEVGDLTYLHNGAADDGNGRHKNELGSICGRLLSYNSYLLPLVILSVTGQLCNIAFPKMMGVVFDDVIKSSDVDLLLLITYIYTATILLKVISDFVRINLLHRFRQAVTLNGSRDNILALFSNPLSFFLKRTPVDLIRKSHANDLLHVAYTDGSVNILLGSVYAILFSLLMLLTDAFLGVITTVIGLLIVGIRYYYTSKIVTHQYSCIQYTVMRDETLNDYVARIEQIKLSHQEAVAASNWMHYQTLLQNSRSALDKLSMQIQQASSALGQGQTLAIIWFGAHAVLDGVATPGAILAFVFYKNFFMEQLLSLVDSGVKVRLASVETDRLADFHSTPSQPEVPYIDADGENICINTVQLENVSFSYSRLQAPVISNFSCTLRKGEKILITGESGAGKSTVLHLFAGLLDPENGAMKVNGVEIERYGRKRYQKRIALVSQNDRVSDSTVIENIVGAEGDIDIKRIYNCIRHAGLQGVVDRLYSGINTRIGSGGAGLSLGEQKRLLIARALYNEPDIIILDEPTANLDECNRALIFTTLTSLPAACVIASHDQSARDFIRREIIVSRPSNLGVANA